MFNAPVGFKYIRSKIQGKILVKDEPVASIVTGMMEGFAPGRFQTKREAKYFLEQALEFPKTASGKIGNNRVDAILGKKKKTILRKIESIHQQDAATVYFN